MMENEDKLLRDLLQTEGEEIKAPDNFTDKVMDKIDLVAAKKVKPIIGWPGKVFLILFALTLCVLPFIAGEVPQDSWAANLEVQNGINQSIAFIQEYALIGLLIVTILSFILIDKFLRPKKVSLR